MLIGMKQTVSVNVQRLIIRFRPKYSGYDQKTQEECLAAWNSEVFARLSTACSGLLASGGGLPAPDPLLLSG